MAKSSDGAKPLTNCDRVILVGVTDSYYLLKPKKQW